MLGKERRLSWDSEILSFYFWFFTWACFCSLTWQHAAGWTGNDLATGTCRGNLGNIREEIVGRGSSLSTKATTDFEAEMWSFVAISQPKRKLSILICWGGLQWIKYILICPFIFKSSLHIELAKSSKMISKTLTTKSVVRKFKMSNFFMMDGKGLRHVCLGLTLLLKC